MINYGIVPMKFQTVSNGFLPTLTSLTLAGALFEVKSTVFLFDRQTLMTTFTSVWRDCLK